MCRLVSLLAPASFPILATYLVQMLSSFAVGRVILVSQHESLSRVQVGLIKSRHFRRKSDAFFAGRSGVSHDLTLESHLATRGNAGSGRGPCRLAMCLE
jgi:hypothetical protein